MNKNRVTPTEVGVVGVCTDFSCNNCKKKSNKRLLKIFAAGGLAFFMGVGTLCGVLIAPMNAAHATTSGATSASNAANPAGVAQSPDSALSPQEQLLAGTPKLDPENDPVICTTESGLEIKYAQETISANPEHYNPELGGVSTSVLTNYAYVQMGLYNWIIIGYNNTKTSMTVNYEFDGVLEFSNYLENPTRWESFAGLLETDSDAGAAINNASTNGLIWANLALSVALDYSLAKLNTTELSSGELLLLCEQSVAESRFGSSSLYPDSQIITIMRGLYYPEENLNDADFTKKEGELIVKKTLTTPRCSDTTEYIFPLAYAGSSFYYGDYITIGQMNLGFSYWLRSGFQGKNYAEVYYVKYNGTLGSTSNWMVSDGAISKYGVRPAMVIKF